jgi:hypothetical protein
MGSAAWHPAGQALSFWPLGPLGILLPLKFAINLKLALRGHLLASLPGDFAHRLA